MRSREQFIPYVYAKAEAEQAQGRKRRRLMFSSIAACSVCICVISAAFLMPHGFNNKNETMADGAPSLDALARCDLCAKAGMRSRDRRRKRC